jgi:hypothetical protein
MLSSHGRRLKDARVGWNNIVAIVHVVTEAQIMMEDRFAE